MAGSDGVGRFTVKFHGVRGSHAAPGKSTMRYGGHTTCMEVRTGGHLIIIDAGTGIIPLGGQLLQEYQRNPIVATLLFTHTHHDHMQGFPFFRPAYMGQTTVYMFGPSMFAESLEEVLGKTMLSPYFPVDFKDMKSMKIIRTINDSSVIFLKEGSDRPELAHLERDSDNIPADAVRITAFKSYAHPKDGVMVYRIAWKDKSLVCATDTEGYVGGDRRLIEFSRGADVLIHDAQYLESEYSSPTNPKQGWGHSTPGMAAQVAIDAGVHRLVVTHHDPNHNDETVARMEKEAQAKFPNAIAAYERLEVDLFALDDQPALTAAPARSRTEVAG